MRCASPARTGFRLCFVIVAALATGLAAISPTPAGAAPATLATADQHYIAYNETFNRPAPGVLANDTGTGITVTSNTQPTRAVGPVVVAPDGSFAYTPTAGYAGFDSFSYTITDSSGATSTAQVQIITQLPAGARAVRDDYTTAYNEPLVVAAPGVLANDIGTGLRVTGNYGASYGTVAIGVDGQLSYTPNLGFTGTDSVVYAIADQWSRSSLGSVTIAVAAPAAPTASDDGPYAVAFESPITVDDVLANDTGTGLRIINHTNGTNGTVTFTADTVSYTPYAGFTGDDQFVYFVEDGFGRGTSATVRVTVAAPTAPTAADDGPYNVTYEGTVTIDDLLANDTGSQLTVVDVTGAAHGTVTFTDDTVTYTADPGWGGDDTVTYTVEDRFARQVSASFIVTTALPTAPVATNDGPYRTEYQTEVVVSDPAAGLLANDTGTGLTVSASHAETGALDVAPDGTFTYEPENGAAGPVTFSYTISDGFGRTSSATSTVTIALPAAPTPADDGPFVAAYGESRTVSLAELLANDTGTELRVIAVGDGAHGVTTGDDATLTYTPDAHWAGDDQVTYTVVDRFGRMAEADITFVTSLPAAPTAADADLTTPYATAASGAVAATGTDVTLVYNDDAGAGRVDFAEDRSFTYTPDVAWAGEDTFTYTVTDRFDRTATGSVTVTTGAADADLSVHVTADGPLVVDEPATWTVEVTNNGPTTAPAGSTLVLTVDEGITIDGFTVVGAAAGTAENWDCTLETQTLTCVLPVELPVGAASPIEVQVTAHAGSEGTAASTLVVDGPASEEAAATGDVTVDVLGSSDLSILKTLAGDGLVVGATASWNLAVTNDGPSEAVAVTVTDVLPSGLLYTGVTGDGWACDAEAQTVTCVLADPLDDGATSTLSLVTEVTASAGDVVVNTASVHSSSVDRADANDADAAPAVTVLAAPQVPTTPEDPDGPDSPTDTGPDTTAPDTTGPTASQEPSERPRDDRPTRRDLPRTGTSSMPVGVTGMLVLVGGAVLTGVSRRTRRSH